MADGLSLVLWSLAEYFNYFSVTLIILCTGLMTAFIIRLNGDHFGRYHNGTNQGESSLAYQKDMTSFSNPFFLRLPSSNASSLAKGVLLELSCLEPCEVYVYWGALISPVHAALLKTGTDFTEDARTRSLWRDDCLATERHSFDARGKHSLHLPVPTEVSAEGLGPPPRQRYPCVLVMTTRNSPAGVGHVEHTHVVAMVSVLHLKDERCAMETHLIAQYAKMAGQAVYNLQPLFFASDLDEDEGGRDSSEHGDNSHVSPPSTEEEESSEVGSNSREATPSQQPLLSRRQTTNPVGTDHNNSQRPENHNGERSESNPRTVGEICDASSQELETAPSTGGDADIDSAVQDAPSPDLSWQQGAAFPECIVCQSQQLSYVLLPCRHACVCQVCFHKLDRCPMCRSHIESYFSLHDEEEEEEEGEIESEGLDNAVPMDLYSRFERFNHRLNRWLGFE